MTAREGPIQSGVGQGLRFCAKGGYPGYLLGTSEPEEQKILARSLALNDVFYDIGANIGFYSTLAARLVGKSGRVFAFEPFPESAQACLQNALSNGFDHVTVVEVAVGEENGLVRLELEKFSAGHRLGSGRGIEVPMVGIDSWRAEAGAPPPQLVMIDVEGAELSVLRGMLTTIENARPVIMVEVHWLGEAFLDFVRDSLVPVGYRATTYEGEPLPDGIVRYHALLRRT